MRQWTSLTALRTDGDEYVRVDYERYHSRSSASARRGWLGRWRWRRLRGPRRLPPRIVYGLVRSPGGQHHAVRRFHQRDGGAPRPERRVGLHGKSAHPVAQYGDPAGIQRGPRFGPPRAEIAPPHEVQLLVDGCHHPRLPLPRRTGARLEPVERGRRLYFQQSEQFVFLQIGRAHV